MTPCIRKGLGKSHQYYLRGRAPRSKQNQVGNLETVWVILWELDSVEKSLEKVIEGCITKGRRARAESRIKKKEKG